MCAINFYNSKFILNQNNFEILIGLKKKGTFNVQIIYNMQVF